MLFLRADFEGLVQIFFVGISLGKLFTSNLNNSLQC